MPKPTTPPTDVDLVVEALRSRAETRKRACTQLAAQLHQDREGGGDVRSGAVKVVDELAAADRMLGLADDLAAGRIALHHPLLLTPLAAPLADLLAVPDPPDPGEIAGLVPEHERDADDAEIITVEL